MLQDASGNGHHGKIHGAKWVNADGSAIAIATTDPQRRAAAMVLRHGGRVDIVTSKGTRSITRTEQLPQGRFALKTVALIDTKPLLDADWKALSRSNIFFFKTRRFQRPASRISSTLIGFVRFTSTAMN